MIFYGWYVALVAFLANFMSVGTGFYAMNAFMEPLSQLRGWTRTDINLALVLGTFVGFICQFFYGKAVNRIGPRKMMCMGAIVSGLAFIILGRVERLWLFYTFYILLYMGNGAFGGIVASSAVSNWFIAKRGKALGLATAGMSLSGVVLPFILMYLIVKINITASFSLVGLFTISLVPLFWAVIRDWPEERGLHPDGTGQREDPLSCDHYSSTSAVPNPYPISELVKTPTFWRLGLGFTMMLTGSVGIMSQLKPRFVDLGYGQWEAMFMMCCTAASGTLGKYIWGMLCDRFSPNKVAFALALLNSLGIWFGLMDSSKWALYGFIVIYGNAMGGLVPAFSVMTAYIYGRLYFAHVMKYMYIFLVMELVGYVIAGQSYDRTGSYDGAYWTFMVLNLIAAYLVLGAKGNSR